MSVWTDPVDGAFARLARTPMTEEQRVRITADLDAAMTQAVARVDSQRQAQTTEQYSRLAAAEALAEQQLDAVKRFIELAKQRRVTGQDCIETLKAVSQDVARLRQVQSEMDSTRKQLTYIETHPLEHLDGLYRKFSHLRRPALPI